MLEEAGINTTDYVNRSPAAGPQRDPRPETLGFRRQNMGIVLTGSQRRERRGQPHPSRRKFLSRGRARAPPHSNEGEGPPGGGSGHALAGAPLARAEPARRGVPPF